MKATLTDAQGVSTPLSGTNVAAQLPGEGFFWLDVANATEDEIAALAIALELDDALGAWLPRFGQSTRFEASPRYLRISTWADAGTGGIVEGHLLYSPAWLISVFGAAVSGMDGARRPKIPAADVLPLS